MIVVAFLASAGVYWAATYVQTYLVGWVGQRALQDLRERIYTHLQSMSIGFYTRNRPGVLISRMTNDVQALDTLVTDGIVTLVSSILTLVGVIVILLAIDVELALVTFLTFPVLAIGSIVFRIASANAYRLTREKIANITAYLQETLSGVRVVRSFGQEPRHLSEMSVLNEENREVNMRTVYLNASYFPAVELLSAIGTAVDPPVRRLPGARRQRRDRRPDRVRRLPADVLRPDPADQPALHDLPAGDGGARQDLRPARHRARHRRPAERDRPRRDPRRDRPRGRLVLGYAAETRGRASEDWALRDIDLRILPGQTVALVGETGAGKSTLAKLVARFYDPQRGRILIDGVDVRELDSNALRSQARDRPPGGLPVQRHDRRQRRLRPPRRVARGHHRGAADGRRRAAGRRAAGGARHRGRRARDVSSRPASGRSSRSPGPCSPSRGS